MRYLILILSVLLVSCASPKTAPKAYYGGVYAPGKVVIEANGYRSIASVFEEADKAIARKAAFARLMLDAKEAGYRSFSIKEEKFATVIGTSFTVKGTLYKTARTGEGVYRLDAIKRLLQDLPLEEPKPVYKPKPVKKQQKADRKKSKTVRKKRITASKPKPVVEEPAPAVESVPEDDDEKPLVIMAPEDITGSIRRDGQSSSNVHNAPHSGSTLTPLSGEVDFARPSATSGLPTGVIIRQR